MEMFNYQCPKCLFTHAVPAYWTSFSPDQEIEMPHLDFKTKEMCQSSVMLFIGKENNIG